MRLTFYVSHMGVRMYISLANLYKDHSCRLYSIECILLLLLILRNPLQVSERDEKVGWPLQSYATATMEHWIDRRRAYTLPLKYTHAQPCVSTHTHTHALSAYVCPSGIQGLPSRGHTLVNGRCNLDQLLLRFHYYYYYYYFKVGQWTEFTEIDWSTI